MRRLNRVTLGVAAHVAAKNENTVEAVAVLLVLINNNCVLPSIESKAGTWRFAGRVAREHQATALDWAISRKNPLALALLRKHSLIEPTAVTSAYAFAPTRGVEYVLALTTPNAYLDQHELQFLLDTPQDLFIRRDAVDTVALNVLIQSAYTAAKTLFESSWFMTSGRKAGANAILAQLRDLATFYNQSQQIALPEAAALLDARMPNVGSLRRVLEVNDLLQQVCRQSGVQLVGEFAALAPVVPQVYVQPQPQPAASAPPPPEGAQLYPPAPRSGLYRPVATDPNGAVELQPLYSSSPGFSGHG